MKVLKQRSQSLMFTRKKNRCNEPGLKNITTLSQFQLFLCIYQKLNCSPPWTFWRVAILLSISTMLLFILTKRVVEFQFHDIHVCVCPWTYICTCESMKTRSFYQTSFFIVVLFIIFKRGSLAELESSAIMWYTSVPTLFRHLLP